MPVVVSIFLPVVAIELAVIIWLLITILRELKELEHPHPHPHPHPRPHPIFH